MANTNCKIKFSYQQTCLEKFKYALLTYWIALRMWWVVWSGYYTREGEPLRCMECYWYKNFEDVTKDSLDGIICEYERRCPNCGHVMGYWAYGYWQNPFV